MASKRARRARRERRKKTRGGGGEPVPELSLGRFWIPLALTLGFFLSSLVPRVADNPVLARSYWGAAAALLLWQAALFLTVRRSGAGRAVQVVLRPQHYIQATVQLAVFGYWGYYWRPVYDHAWLIVGQILFAYAFDLLLSWSRRESYTLGFGPFPIIFSTNLFLWFRDDWFYLQFLMIGVGFLGKEFVRWQRDGRRVHIFNPSAFSLGLFSLVLIATGTTDLTWGIDIAVTLTRAPYIYFYLFCVGLVVMYFFSITLVAASAAITLFTASGLYAAVTGVPYFVSSEIPAAVFLGLLLLVTDPSTSPRSGLGKALFGVLYGVGVIVLYWLLGVLGVPTFYDKLLSVPLLNLSVQWIDRLARRLQEVPTVVRWGEWKPLRANHAHMAVWVVFFGTMAGLGRTDGMHRGYAVPFWQQACAEGRRHACDRLVGIEQIFCAVDSAWACNELGVQYVQGTNVTPNPSLARIYFTQACNSSYKPGCFNLLVGSSGEAAGAASLIRANPRTLDLRQLVREGGATLADMPEPELYARACRHGWKYACEMATN